MQPPLPLAQPRPGPMQTLEPACLPHPLSQGAGTMHGAGRPWSQLPVPGPPNPRCRRPRAPGSQHCFSSDERQPGFQVRDSYAGRNVWVTEPARGQLPQARPARSPPTPLTTEPEGPPLHRHCPEEQEVLPAGRGVPLRTHTVGAAVPMEQEHLLPAGAGTDARHGRSARRTDINNPPSEN